MIRGLGTFLLGLSLVVVCLTLGILLGVWLHDAVLEPLEEGR